MYMQTAVDQYYEEKTTMAQTRKDTSHLIPPVFVACPDPPFKTSFFREHGFKKSGEMERFFWMLPHRWQDKFRNTSATAMEMYMNMSYHLGSDWQIYIMSPVSDG